MMPRLASQYPEAQQTNGRSCQNEPHRIDLPAQQDGKGHQRDGPSEHIREPMLSQLHQHPSHQCERRRVDSIEQRCRPGGLAQPRGDRVNEGNEEKRGEENAQRGECCAREAS